ncbi:hypothetical protein ES703_41675 [subsurface metagenome]
MEYCAAVELTRAGTPHIHALTRGSYISQRWLSAAWRDLTGSYVVHIRKVDHVPGAVDEATKYLVKTAAAVARASPGKPVLTMSRGWLPDDFDDGREQLPADCPSHCFLVLFSSLVEVVGKLGGHVTYLPDSDRRYRIVFPTTPTHDDVYRYVHDRPFCEVKLPWFLLAMANPLEYSLAEFQADLDLEYAFRHFE